jgi:hypothetical protein
MVAEKNMVEAQDLQGRLSVNACFSWKKLAQGCIILDLERGSYFTLNETASLIWEGILAGKAHEAIADCLAKEYEVFPKQAKADIMETIGMLVREGVLEVDRARQETKEQRKES